MALSSQTDALGWQFLSGAGGLSHEPICLGDIRGGPLHFRKALDATTHPEF